MKVEAIEQYRQKAFRFPGVKPPSKTGRELPRMLRWSMAHVGNSKAAFFVFKSRSFRPTAEAMGLNADNLRESWRQEFFAKGYKVKPSWGLDDELGRPLAWSEKQTLQLCRGVLRHYMEVVIQNQEDPNGISKAEAWDWFNDQSTAPFSFAWILRALEGEELTDDLATDPDEAREVVRRMAYAAKFQRQSEE
jgi:hypothetical protein